MHEALGARPTSRQPAVCGLAKPPSSVLARASAKRDQPATSRHQSTSPRVGTEKLMKPNEPSGPARCRRQEARAPPQRRRRHVAIPTPWASTPRESRQTLAARRRTQFADCSWAVRVREPESSDTASAGNGRGQLRLLRRHNPVSKPHRVGLPTGKPVLDTKAKHKPFSWSRDLAPRTRSRVRFLIQPG